jgi:sterol 3beta-glucosyltransferase
MHDRPLPVLHCYSQQVITRPDDWPDHAYVTGYWWLDETNNWQPPADLEAFLANETPPVYVGFGSMIAEDPARVTRIVIEALTQSGQRGVIASGWGGIRPADLPPSIYLLKEAPHDWLFPRMSALVHHGGAGTTAAGLRAGKPTVICPFIADQPFWGNRVAVLGAGPKPIPQKKLNVDDLAAAIRTAATDQAMRTRSEALGAKLRAEDGVAQAVQIIGQLLRQQAAVQRIANAVAFP